MGPTRICISAFIHALLFISASLFSVTNTLSQSKHDHNKDKDTLAIPMVHKQFSDSTSILDSGQQVNVIQPMTKSYVKRSDVTSTEDGPITKKILSNDYYVFGWHPYWMEGAYTSYDYKMLSHIAYFSYEVDPTTGKAKTYHNWLTTPVIDSAKAINPNCKILLTITCFGKDNITFFSDVNRQTTLISEAISLLDQRKADGVNIDFEGIPSGYEANFTNFLQNFASQLHLKNYILTVAVPSIDYYNNYNIPSLNNFVDLYVLMGYGYYGSFSSKPGPISPLLSSTQWGTASIENSVSTYLNKLMPKDKFVVAFPYYGGIWETHDNDSLSFNSYYTYSSYMGKYGSGLLLDTLSVSMYDNVTGTTITEHLWGEDTVSLSGKFDWVLKQGLKGVGIWALGFDNGRSELWDLLGSKFGTEDTTGTPKDTTGTDPGGGGKDDEKEEPKPSTLQSALVLLHKYPSAIMFGFIVLFLAGIFGFLSLYLHEDSADMLREKELYYPGLILAALLLNTLFLVALYFVYRLPVVLLIIYSLFFWTLGFLIYFLIKTAIQHRDIP